MAPEPTANSANFKSSQSSACTEHKDDVKDEAMTSHPVEDESDHEEADERETHALMNDGTHAQEPDLDCYDDPAPPLPPDGGYGWVIVFTSFMINLMVDGMCYMGGVLYIELLDYFQESKGKTQWVHTLVPAVYLTTGPFVGALVNKYGCRLITILGSLLAASSFVISSLAPCVEMMIFTYGIMIGVGFGFMYLPAVCFVSYYFDRRRAMATGIAVCGSGIGTFIFPPMMNIFLNTYGWRGSLLLLAGMTLNCCVFGALLRPLSASKPKPKKLKEQKRTKKELKKDKKMAKEMAKQRSIIMQKIVEQKDRQRTISTGSLDGMVITRDNTLVKDAALLKTILTTETLTKARADSINKSVPDLPTEVNNEKRKKGSNTELSTRSQPCSPQMGKRNGTTHQKEAPAESPKAVNKQLERVRGKLGGSESQLRSRQTSVCSTASKSSKHPELCSTNSLHSMEQKRKDMSRIMYRQDIFYTGSVTSIAEYRSNPDMSQYVQSVVSIPGSIQASEGRCAPCTNILFQMFDLKLCKSVTFVVLMANAFFSFLGFFVPFMFIPDLSKMQGASVQKSAILISILGIANTVGRVAAGWLADRPWADCLVIQNVALLTGGVATILVPLYVNYTLLAIYCVIFGTCMAMFIALRSIVTAEMLGIQKLNNAFGLTIFFQGIAGIAGSPLAGTIFDATGSYAISFIIAGAFITFSGLICLPLRRIARWETSRSDDDMEIDFESVNLPFPEKDEESSCVESREVKFVENQNENESHKSVGFA